MSTSSNHIVVTFGEIMGRMAAPGNVRLRQTREINLTYAGAEASVAVSVQNFGGTARYVTALPQHALAEAAVDSVRAMGVDTTHILRTPNGRLGMYYLETGANQRASQVIYDRDHSAVSITPAESYDWDAIFEGATWLHLSGITPALSQTAYEATLAAAKMAHARGICVSIDLNFRKKLWNWDSSMDAKSLARKCMANILPHTSVVIGNEEDCADVLDIHAPDTDVQSGKLNTAAYTDVAKSVVALYPQIKKVAITLRESYSATHNNWGAMVYDATQQQPHFAPINNKGEYQPYEIKNIVDRVGGGDSFAGGLIYALTTEELKQPEKALPYAVAASCLKHSILGDFNMSTRSEVEALVAGNTSGRVQR
jgi:2-dehydro-3-deoxygluconokinase